MDAYGVSRRPHCVAQAAIMGGETLNSNAGRLANPTLRYTGADYE